MSTYRAIYEVAENAIRDGRTDDEALAIVKAEFPEGRTTIACIQWYRSNLRRGGEDIPLNSEVKRMRRADMRAKPREMPADSHAEPFTGRFTTKNDLTAFERRLNTRFAWFAAIVVIVVLLAASGS